MPQQITDWGGALWLSVSQSLAILLAAIPRVIGFLAILLIGWLIAGLVAKGVAALLRSIRFNELSTRSGFGDFVAGTGADTDASGFIALVAKWFVRLMVLVVAFDALGLPAVSDVLRQLLLWLPNLVVALVVLVIGGLVANALAGLVRASTARAGIENPDMLARFARVGVWGFAIIVAVNQLGIATTLINTLFMAIVGAVALAVGLAFGLGGRDTAAEIVRSWHARTARTDVGAAIDEAGRRTVGDQGRREMPPQTPRPRM
ncbi:MAG TPA: hypothetical protein VFV47_01410 [Hyphomicrobiaceae bacterium]|nr:hypothetical protein [Hyphomicrobiaceae bacterium]